MSTARPSLLVIDDELGMREMLSFELKLEGFEVETVDSGQGALAALKRRRFDLAITDLKMPGMNGVATLEALKRADPDIEVIVATGYADVDSAVACMKGGAYDYIQKPYDVRELKALLERAREKNHLRGIVDLYEGSRGLLSTLHAAELVDTTIVLACRVLRADDAVIVRTLRAGDATIFGLSKREWSSDVKISEMASFSQSEKRTIHNTDNSGATLSYPLWGRRGSLGALVVYRKPEGPIFSHTELQRGYIFANQLSLALDNSILYEELETKLRLLVQTRDQLVQAEKLSLTGRLAGVVAHEINNPLTSVLANLEVLIVYSSTVTMIWEKAKEAGSYLRRLSTPDATVQASRLLGPNEAQTEKSIHEIGDILEEIVDGARRIQALVAGFGSIAQLEEGAPAERIELSSFVEAKLGEGGEWGKLGRRIVSETERSVVMASPGDLGRALTSILKWLCGKGRNPAESILLSVRQENDYAVILLSDQHLELSEAARRSLFDPKIEVDTEKGRTMRMNISLTLAHALLLGNSAIVSLETIEGRGLRFRIAIPVAT